MHRACLGRGAFLLMLVTVGCSNGSKNPDAPVSTEPLASCQSFIQAFEHCQAKLKAPGNVTSERIATTRDSLHTQTEAAKTEAARALLDKQCKDGVMQLASTCP